jgi:hypothetical protein
MGMFLAIVSLVEEQFAKLFLPNSKESCDRWVFGMDPNSHLPPTRKLPRESSGVWPPKKRDFFLCDWLGVDLPITNSNRWAPDFRI